MLTEEAHHMFVGETGMGRVVRRTAQLMKESPNGDVRASGGIPLEIIQKYINFWYSYSLDLFGGEISSNAADFFASGLKGRYREQEIYEDHVISEGFLPIEVIENEQVKTREVPLRTALNEVLRREYAKDSTRGLDRWNKILGDEGIEERLYLPSPRFHRHVGEYAGTHFDVFGNLISADEYDRRSPSVLPTKEDRDYVRSVMAAVIEPGKIAGWIAPPKTGINRQTPEFEYVRI